jgi:hypothetical protein
VSPYLPKLKRVLVLTPDSIGSTFFQRSLTLFLNMNGIPTKNYHDLAVFAPDLNSLVDVLTTSTNSTIARVSPYRSEEFGERKDLYLKVCNIFFTEVYTIDRCSFESAISYCNRRLTDSPLNVYSKKEYLDNEVTAPYSIPIRDFISSLKYFEDFYVWVDKYFPNHKKINHDDIIRNTDTMYRDMFSVYNNLDYSIVDYNKFNFLRVRSQDSDSYSKEKVFNYININEQIQELVNNKLLPTMASFPIKKITLEEKTNKIANFKELLDIYNKYPSNHFAKISEEQVANRIQEEQLFWIT